MTGRRDYGNGSIDERTPGRWRITIELPPDPLTGRRRRRRFAVQGGKKAAQRALRDALTERDHGIDVRPEKITVGDWLTRWLARHHAEGHVSAKTHDRYRGIIAHHLMPRLGAIALRDLRPDHIADCKGRWLSGEDSTASRPLANSTVHKHLVVLHEALDDAVKANVIVRNPADAVSAPSVRVQLERRALTEQEIETLLGAAAASRIDVPIRFTLAAGVRQGELLALRWSDADLARRVVRVRRAMSYVGGAVQFHEPKTKNARRSIELSPATADMVRRHKRAQYEERLRLGPAWHDHGLVFPSRIGTPWLPRPLLRSYRAIVDASGIEQPSEVNWHTLRHTAASQWLRHGADVFSVSRRLGHASASFTMDVYAHLLEGQQEQAARALDHLLA